MRAGTTDALHAPPPPELDAEDRALLLDVARSALAVATGLHPAAVLRDARRAAGGRHVGEIRAAVFVTLTERDQLRGCIGTPDALHLLPDGVAAAALSSALDDPRFLPVASDELPAIHVDISVLGPFAELPPSALPCAGLEGVVVEQRGHRGLLLPEVAITQSWDALMLLRAASRKAGLPDDAWREAGTLVLAFRTVRFGGPAATGDDAQGPSESAHARARAPAERSSSHIPRT